MNTLEVKSRQAWRDWLAANHDTETVVWFVFYKKHTGKATVSYDDAVEVALCYGWIDSTVRKLDDERYIQQFTPRRATSTWSALNRKRVARLTRAGLMTDSGLNMVKIAKRTGRWNRPKDRPKLTYNMPDAFAEALKRNKKALKTFENLAPSYRKQYIGWIEEAKRPETKVRRIRESVQLLARGMKLGMK